MSYLYLGYGGLTLGSTQFKVRTEPHSNFFVFVTCGKKIISQFLSRFNLNPWITLYVLYVYTFPRHIVCVGLCESETVEKPCRGEMAVWLEALIFFLFSLTFLLLIFFLSVLYYFLFSYFKRIFYCCFNPMHLEIQKMTFWTIFIAFKMF